MVQQVRVRRGWKWMSLGSAFALASVVIGLGAPAAHATDLVQITTCGQAVASDAILVKNLTCPGDGVIVTGDGVTVDLGGHFIRSSTGTGRGIAIEAPCPSTETVRGPGKVRGFQAGIDGLTCSGLLGSPPSPTVGIRRHLIVDGAELLDNTSGIQTASGLTDVTATTIRGTHGIVTNNPLSTGSDSVGDLNIDRSSITSTVTALRGINFSRFHVSHSNLRGGTISLQSNSGFQMEDSTMRDVTFWCSETGVQFERSRLMDNSMEIGSFCGGSFTNNDFRSTKGGTGLNPITTDSNPLNLVIDGNRFFGWDDAIRVGPYARGIQITGNWFQGNVTGVRDERDPRANPTYCTGYEGGAIRNNTFTRNTGDAVFLDCGEWAVGGNRMMKNDGLGISATGPLLEVSDEGGNVARGNAEPQCVGVVCTRR